ncbi:MAG: OsmC family protein [Gammaproteobacteria bacterium]|nr:OsmC family protein [Gammaproteobacteria bacterium]
MSRQKVEFEGRNGTLAGALELPAGTPHAYALFAHCFTCGKDIAAASRISRTLAAHGIGVLRFDFTGLGGSDGDFANAGFSSNIEDLLAAAAWLREQHAAPTLLVGHSLGGTAMLAAAGRIDEARAVVTIGSPASPEHVIAHFGADLERIEQDGEADVTLAGRTFRISKSFLDDLRDHSLSSRIHTLRKALLVMHAPRDTTVDIDEASKIFQAALHPKSFVSLDDADHLLSRIEHAQYAADTIAAWASRYLPGREASADVKAVAGGHLRIDEGNHRFLRHVSSDDHAWLADEPKRVGGDNLGPDPYEHLLAALGACTSMTIRMYANRKQWPLTDIQVELVHSREHAADCDDCEDSATRIDVITRRIRLEGDLSDEQRQRLMEIADRCPVHRTLENEIRIDTTSADR